METNSLGVRAKGLVRHRFGVVVRAIIREVGREKAAARFGVSLPTTKAWLDGGCPTYPKCLELAEDLKLDPLTGLPS